MTKLKETRQLLGLSAAQAGAIIGYSQSHFSLIERGGTPASHDAALDQLQRVIAAHQVQPLADKLIAAERQLKFARLLGCPLGLSKAKRAQRDARRVLDKRAAQLAAFGNMELGPDGAYRPRNGRSPLDRRYSRRGVTQEGGD